jgi:Peptidase inhibitor family I36
VVGPKLIAAIPASTSAPPRPQMSSNVARATGSAFTNSSFEGTARAWNCSIVLLMSRRTAETRIAIKYARGSFVNVKKILAGAAALGAAVTLMSAGPASAAPQDGVCNASAYSLDPIGEICLYYNSGLAGSRFDWAFPQANITNFATYPASARAPLPGTSIQFLTSGLAGYGQTVKNNAASAYDRYYGASVYVYFNSGFSGTSDFVGSLTSRNLSNTYNENASLRWVS